MPQAAVQEVTRLDKSKCWVEAVVVLTLPETLNPPVLRTDFSDEAAWHAIRLACAVPSAEGFLAGLSFVSDRAFANLTIGQIAALAGQTSRSFLFVADRISMSDPEMPIIAVDLRRERGRWFRVIPAKMWSVENNLSLSNMDFFEFARAAGADGIFRGFAR